MSATDQRIPLSVRSWVTIFLLILFFSHVQADDGASNLPEELKVDPLDLYIDDILRNPPNGYIACQHLYSVESQMHRCQFGVNQFCNLQDVKACAESCDARGSGEAQCFFGCYAGNKYSC